VIRENDPLWAQELFATQLLAALAGQAVAYQNFCNGDVEFGGQEITEPPADDCSARMEALTGIVTRVNELLTPATVTAAFGADGYSGDETAVRLFASSLAGVFTDALQWGRSTRAVIAPPKWDGVYVALSNFARDPLAAISDFANDFDQRVRTIAADLAAGRTPSTTLSLTLHVGLSDDALATYHAALDQVGPAAAPTRRRWFSRR
jgi:hypothetical protein